MPRPSWESARTTSFSWWTQRTLNSLRITLTGDADTTRVDVTEKIGERAVGAHLAAVAGSGFVASGLGFAVFVGGILAAPAVAAGAGVFGASHLGARWVVRRRVRAAETEMRIVIEALRPVFD